MEILTKTHLKKRVFWGNTEYKLYRRNRFKHYTTIKLNWNMECLLTVWLLATAGDWWHQFIIVMFSMSRADTYRYRCRAKWDLDRGENNLLTETVLVFFRVVKIRNSLQITVDWLKITSSSPWSWLRQKQLMSRKMKPALRENNYTRITYTFPLNYIVSIC